MSMFKIWTKNKFLNGGIYLMSELNFFKLKIRGKLYLKNAMIILVILIVLDIFLLVTYIS